MQEPTVKFHYYSEIWAPDGTYRLAIIERRSINGNLQKPIPVYLGAFTTKQETDLLRQLLPKEWESDTRLSDGYIDIDDNIIKHIRETSIHNKQILGKCDWLKPIRYYVDSLYPHLKEKLELTP
jgi:hypothetical protein